MTLTVYKDIPVPVQLVQPLQRLTSRRAAGGSAERFAAYAEKAGSLAIVGHLRNY